ncbi:hypothetical protein [Chitinophaga rhizophila]|uniref:IrrE N-terminal-like domain-containing protein n=1 Tax=Chitinophaga rhizophila TaxID=2866212 RepID=A0ABS7GB73_9BACT|nr:hypothetical protein [Chitinophaga rhizophila]MBW8684666.1 hypothetical protein [Chitinophaga rhizophila]
MPYTADIITTMVQFIESIGIPVVFETINEPTFVPGILVNKGTLIVDRKQLSYPGDLLHEAGHIAVAIPADRQLMHGDVGAISEKGKADGEEMMAIAWSYAACVYLGIDPAVVFHSAGYKGAADWYIEQYTSGTMLYVPVLQWAGFCYDAAAAANNGVQPFPHMIRWMRA